VRPHLHEGAVELVERATAERIADQVLERRGDHALRFGVGPRAVGRELDNRRPTIGVVRLARDETGALNAIGGLARAADSDREFARDFVDAAVLP
jgi:hypothetical protein